MNNSFILSLPFILSDSVFLLIDISIHKNRIDVQNEYIIEMIGKMYYPFLNCWLFLDPMTTKINNYNEVELENQLSARSVFTQQ